MSIEAIRELETLASVCPELNMANYTEDDVRHLNDWAIEMSLLVERYALSQQPANVACKSVQKRLAAQQPTQATQATPSIPSDGPSTYAQRFTAAVAVICGVTPPVALVCDWINKEERHDDLQQWVGSYAPGWVQNIAVLDAAHQMADQPTEGGNHEPAQQPATAIACGIPGMAKTTCPYCEQGFAFEHEQPATDEPVAWMASYVDPVGNDRVYVTSHRDLAVENDMHGEPKPLYTRPAPSVPKDDQIAALVNKVRDIARMFHDHQSLRERIAIELVPALKVSQEAKSDAERGRFLIEWLKRYGLLHAEFGQMGVGKKPENWWLLHAPWGIDQTRPFLGHGKTPEQAIDDAKEEPLTVATSTRTERRP